MAEAPTKQTKAPSKKGFGRFDSFSKVKAAALETKNSATQEWGKFTSSVKSKMISKETEECFKDIIALLHEQFKDEDVSTLDFMMGLLLLSSYYRNNTPRTGKIVEDLNEVAEGFYHMKFASGAYGWKLLYGLGKFGLGQAKGLASGAVESDKTNLECLCSHTGLKPEDVVETKWTSDVVFDPGHYIALDHSRKAIVVALRGTFHVRDALVDLAGRNEPFIDGHAHAGMLRTARNKMEAFEPILKETLGKYPDYRIKVVGHSLGAGTAGLLTILLMEAHPDWNIEGWCFAPPCIVSENVSTRYKDHIKSFVYNNDVVPRLSLGSLEALKNTTIQLLSQSENNLQRMYHVINAGNSFEREDDAKIGSLLKVKQQVDISKVDTTKSDAEKLVPPGTVYFMYKEKFNQKNPTMELSENHLFTEIVVASDMYQDHMPTTYESAFTSVMEGMTANK